MKATKLIAVAVIAAAPLALPTAVRADIPDTYTVTIDPTAVLPGGTVNVTATDNAAEPGPDCGLASYTVTLGYTKVGGDEASANVASGQTDSDDAHISTSFTVPEDAASSDAAGSTASVSVAVDCGQQQTPELRRSHATPQVVVPATPAALTVKAYPGTIDASPNFGFRNSKVNVTLQNCHGGPISASFMSYGHDSTTIDVSNYDAGALEANGSFTVPDTTTYGPGDITGSCWQSSYDPKSFTVNNEDEEFVHGVASSSGGNPAPRAHAVKATPTFTG